MEVYRPPEIFLSHFWILTEGNDEKRVEATVQLVKMIQAVEKKTEREQITTYCINRLVRGLGSGRKFARVGFSTALTLLLRLQQELKTSQVLHCFTEKLKLKGNALSKAERSALYLGHAFALSAIIKSGRLSKIHGGLLNAVVRDLLSLADKRSFLKPVCCKAMENLIGEISQDSFVDHVWPLISVELSRGWEECTLDRLSLLLVCIEKFPDVVNKKFTKSHWGPSIFSEDNDEKLLQSLKNSTEKSNALREKILPFMLGNGRDALSIWKGLGEKMFFSGKDNVISQQQLVALEVLNNIIALSSDNKEVWSLILIPSVVKAIFLEKHTQNQAIVKTLNMLVSNVCERLKSMEGYLLSFVKRVLKWEKVSEVDAHDGKLFYIDCSNFAKIVSLMDKTEMEQYVTILIEFVKGNDNNTFFSESGRKREKQLDWCFRQLQHVCCSQVHTSPVIQRLILSLFLRNGFFKGDKKNNTILHCDFLDRFVETNSVKKLCESFLFKSLDQLSTMKSDEASKANHFAGYMDLLSYLVHYFQSLLSCQEVQLVSAWTEKTIETWHQLLKRIKSIEDKTPMNDQESAFRLLYFYMAFYLLTDNNSATDLLKDIFICHDKSAAKANKTRKGGNEDEPYWVEVLTEILLQLLSFQSHLARIVSSMVFKLIVPYLNAESLTLITQVLLPDKTQHNLVFEEDGDDEGDDLLHDLPCEKNSDKDDNDNDNERGDYNEERAEIDEAFRSSLKEALGNAAFDDDHYEHEDLSDMSDSEMFKLDEALAEVFRQRKRQTGQKKAREEKRKEIGNFRLRVLDLLDILIKSNRYEDFFLDLLKPLTALMFTSNQVEEQAAYNRAISSFHLLKTRCKGITDSVRSEKEQIEMFEELMDLAQRVNDSSQLQQIAQACCLVIKVSSANCMQILQDILSNIINKKQSKPLPSFFITLVATDPVIFQPLSSILIACLQNESAKQQCRSMVCSLLTSLAKRRGNVTEGVSESANNWMKQAATVACECVQALDKDNTRGLFVRELLALILVLLGRTDVLSKGDFGSGVQQKLLEIKSKMGTDTRRLTNKIIAAFERLSKETEKMKGKKEKKEGSDSQKMRHKRKLEDIESPNTKSKKKKMKEAS